jgi:uncharacterized protein
LSRKRRDPKTAQERHAPTAQRGATVVTSSFRVQQQKDSITFRVRVHPGARHQRLTGVLGDALKLDIIAPPVDGKANEACVQFFADFLKLPRSSVTIAAGASNRTKVIRIAGIGPATLRQALQSLLES